MTRIRVPLTIRRDTPNLGSNWRWASLPYCHIGTLVKKPAPLLMLLLLASGCEGAATDQPLPTVDSSGKLNIPAGYKPGPQTDLSRVDCPQYLAMTPVEIRSEIRSLCASSTTPEERARNPYCETQRVTEYCERSQ